MNENKTLAKRILMQLDLHSEIYDHNLTLSKTTQGL